MDYNQLFFILFDELKRLGRIKSYVQLAEIIGTNKAGVNDLKTGRKKVTIENIHSMINSYPDINIKWLITGRGNVFDSDENLKNNESLIDRICELSAENALLKKENKELKLRNYNNDFQYSSHIAVEPKLK